MATIEERLAALEKRFEDVAQLKDPPTPQKAQKKKREPNAYNKFMSGKMEELKTSRPDMKHTERFSECARQWKEQKASVTV